MRGAPARSEAAVAAYRVVEVRPASEASIASIIRRVAAAHGLTPRDLMCDSRHPRLVAARHEAMFEAARATRASYPVIGRVFGGRDHSTVISAIRKHARRHGLVPPRGVTLPPLHSVHSTRESSHV